MNRAAHALGVTVVLGMAAVALPVAVLLLRESAHLSGGYLLGAAMLGTTVGVLVRLAYVMGRRTRKGL